MTNLNNNLRVPFEDIDKYQFYQLTLFIYLQFEIVTTKHNEINNKLNSALW